MQNLRELRNKANLTQSELASLVGLTQGSIGHYENGKRELSVTEAKKIINVLASKGVHCTLDGLYEDSFKQAS